MLFLCVDEVMQWILDIYSFTGCNSYILTDGGPENLGSLPKTLALLGCTSLTFTPHMSRQRGTAERTIALLRQHIKKAYIHVRPKANTTTDYRVLLTIALQSLNEQAPQGVTISRRQLYFGLAANIPWSFHTQQDSLELWTEDYIKQLKGLDTLYRKRILLAQKRANMARQNNLVYKPNQLVLFSEITKQTDAILTPHIVLKITSHQCNDCENKPSTAIQIQCLNTGKKKVTDKSNLYPLLGSDYISPKLLQYVTQLHSRAKQETTTQPLNDEISPPSQLTQTGAPETDLSSIERTFIPDTTMQNQQTQDMPTVDTEILSPDPTRDNKNNKNKENNIKNNNTNNNNNN